VAESCYHLQYPLQAASSETFGYTLVFIWAMNIHCTGHKIFLFFKLEEHFVSYMQIVRLAGHFRTLYELFNVIIVIKSRKM
jgi:hypothetical protein